MLKGISGGERKRTSIGYELITDPKLILLDEPTSGLDSTTAYKIVKILKKEAQRNLTVISTIHQPSSEIFITFDRLILLHEGHLIYQGPAKLVAEYLNNNNIPMPKFKNPADFIIRLVQNPKSVKEDLTVKHLYNLYQQRIQPSIKEEMEKTLLMYEHK